MVTRREIELANQRGQSLRNEFPHAIAARYDRQNHKIVIDLSSRVTLSFSPEDAQGLENARPSELESIELSPAGLGIPVSMQATPVAIPTPVLMSVTVSR